MELITKLIAWFSTNWQELAAGLAAIIGAASVIVKLTPTLKDDNYLKPLIKFIGKWVALDKYSPPKPPAA